MREIEKINYKTTLYFRAYKRFQKIDNTRIIIICKVILKI